ncbi:MAG TPA: hypothetical protein VJB16_07690 [archaeon]|nr:hypothetical protein [archaeon]
MAPQLSGYPTSFAIRLWKGTMAQLRAYVACASADLAEQMRLFPDDPTLAILSAPSDLRSYLFELGNPNRRLRAEVYETDGGGL